MKKLFLLSSLLFLISGCDSILILDDAMHITWNAHITDLYLNNKQIYGGSVSVNFEENDQITLRALPNEDEGWVFDSWYFTKPWEGFYLTENPLAFSFKDKYSIVSARLQRFNVYRFMPSVDGRKVFFQLYSTQDIDGIIYDFILDTYTKYKFEDDEYLFFTGNNQMYLQKIDSSSTRIKIFNWDSNSFSLLEENIPFTETDRHNKKNGILLSNDLSHGLYVKEDSARKEECLEIYNITDNSVLRKVFYSENEYVLDYYWSFDSQTIIVKILRRSDWTVHFTEYNIGDLSVVSSQQTLITGDVHTISKVDSSGFQYLTVNYGPFYRLYALNLRKHICTSIDQFETSSSSSDFFFPELLINNGVITYGNSDGIYKLNGTNLDQILSYSNTSYKKGDSGMQLPNGDMLIRTDMNYANDLYYNNNGTNNRISIPSVCK